jgi:hypothetical protein
MGWSFQWRPLDPETDDSKSDWTEGRPEEEVHPRRNTEEIREKQPGTRTRDEIRERPGYRKKP